MKRLLSFFAFTTALLGANLQAAEPIRVIATVNDQVISSTDLEERVRLVTGTTGLSDTPEVRQKLVPQVLRLLIDETLQLQEGAANGITVTEEDLKQAQATIEQRSGKPLGSLEADLDARNIPKLSFYAQLRAQITWARLILRKVRPRIRVSDEEVARAASRAAASQNGTSEVQISVIRLPVDDPGAEAGMKTLADKLVGEISAGASFEAVAQQFASSMGAQAISEMWVGEAQIDPVIAQALRSLTPGGITPPVKTVSGYQIIKLHDRRTSAPDSESSAPQPDAELAIRRITLTLKTDAKQQEASLMLTVAREVAKNPGTCFDKNIAGVEDITDMDIQVSYVRQMESKLPPELREVIRNVPVGGISEPYASPQGIELYMLCERVEMPAQPVAPDLAEKERIRQALIGEKVDLEAQKYMRNLRRDAFIDVRL